MIKEFVGYTCPCMAVWTLYNMSTMTKGLKMYIVMNHLELMGHSWLTQLVSAKAQ